VSLAFVFLEVMPICVQRVDCRLPIEGLVSTTHSYFLHRSLMPNRTRHTVDSPYTSPPRKANIIWKFWYIA